MTKEVNMKLVHIRACQPSQDLRTSAGSKFLYNIITTKLTIIATRLFCKIKLELITSNEAAHPSLASFFLIHQAMPSTAFSQRTKWYEKNQHRLDIKTLKIKILKLTLCRDTSGKTLTFRPCCTNQSVILRWTLKLCRKCAAHYNLWVFETKMSPFLYFLHRRLATKTFNELYVVLQSYEMWATNRLYRRRRS